ncbi:MAG: hypothetical protein HYU42_06845 [Candidatus Rokubacteria bacterium]|nr:hypothetical protein [Candidatus Rokubacteria bacterium]
MPSVWFWLGKVVAGAIRPWMAAREFAYHSRPHCRFPSVRRISWGANHVVCGEPPVDAVDVHNVQTIAEIVTGGRDAGMLPSALVRLLVIPGILGSLADRTGELAVCAAHRDFLWGDIAAAVDSADPEDQERFKQWTLEHIPPESQEGFKQWLQERMPPESK